MAVEMLHCALEDMQDSANRGIVKMLAAECKGRAAAAAMSASRLDARSRSAQSAPSAAGATDEAGELLYGAAAAIAVTALCSCHGPKHGNSVAVLRRHAHRACALANPRTQRRVDVRNLFAQAPADPQHLAAHEPSC